MGKESCIVKGRRTRQRKSHNCRKAARSVPIRISTQSKLRTQAGQCRAKSEPVWVARLQLGLQCPLVIYFCGLSTRAPRVWGDCGAGKWILRSHEMNRWVVESREKE